MGHPWDPIQEPTPASQSQRVRTQGDPLALAVIIILAGATLIFYYPFLVKAAKESR